MSAANGWPAPCPGSGRGQAPFQVTREVLDRLSPLHRLAGEAALRDGRWVLVDGGGPGNGAKGVA
jgi:hypothetical protein